MRTLAVTFVLLFGSVAFGTPVRGEGVESLPARGPSAHASVDESSAYSRPKKPPEFMARAQSPEATSVSPPRLRLSRSKKETANGEPRPSGRRSEELFSGLTDSSTTTAIAALAFVVGLFLLFTWVVKRGMPRSSRLLPSEAVRMLGRVPLAARQFGHLLQVGNKIVLLSVTPNGIEKIAEIDEPQEVGRLLEVCGDGNRGSSQKEFDAVFGKFAKEPTEKGFLGGDPHAFLGGSRHA